MLLLTSLVHRQFQDVVVAYKGLLTHDRGNTVKRDKDGIRSSVTQNRIELLQLKKNFPIFTLD